MEFGWSYITCKGGGHLQPFHSGSDLRNYTNFGPKILPYVSYIFEFLGKFLIQLCFWFNSHKIIINYIPFSKLKNSIKIDIQNGAVLALASEKIVHNFFVKHIQTTCKSNFFPEFKALQLLLLHLLLMAADTPLIHEKCQKNFTPIDTIF